jgi:site-specific DNA-methyltransferase (adenine-specific)
MTVDFKCMRAEEYLETFPNNFFQLSITDPPYIISKKTGFMDVGKKGNPQFKMQQDYGEWDNIPIAEHHALLNLVSQKIYEKLIPGGVLIMFYDYWKLESLKKILENNKFKMFKLIEWQKTNPVPVNSKVFYLSGVREMAIACVKEGNPKFKCEYHNGIFSFPIYQPKKGKRIHPNEKSIPLVSELIKIHSDVGDNILDPFAGSASILLASLQLNRNAYGCEKDKKYYKKAKEKLDSYLYSIKGMLTV